MLSVETHSKNQEFILPWISNWKLLVVHAKEWTHRQDSWLQWWILCGMVENTNIMYNHLNCVHYNCEGHQRNVVDMKWSKWLIIIIILQHLYSALWIKNSSMALYNKKQIKNQTNIHKIMKYMIRNTKMS